jgi:hypothetical protein
VTIINAKGKRVTVDTTNATVRTATSGTTADVSQGSTIIVRGTRAQDASIDAGEILVLPVGTKFVTSPPGGRS